MWRLEPLSPHLRCPTAPPHAHKPKSTRINPLPRRQIATYSSIDGDSRFDNAAAAAADAQPPPPLLTFADVERDCAERGMALRLRTLGPWWELTLEDAQEEEQQEQQQAKSEKKKKLLLARAVGVTALGICHLDSLVVSTRRTRGDAGVRVRGGGFAGTGGLMAQAVFCSAFERGRARKVEVLAVDDGAGSEHDRLVRAYARVAGFKEVKRVEGDRLGDVPHMLVWGAAGTRMDSEVEGQLRKWGAARTRRRKRKTE